jgi:hypothetical protein
VNTLPVPLLKCRSYRWLLHVYLNHCQFSIQSSIIQFVSLHLSPHVFKHFSSFLHAPCLSLQLLVIVLHLIVSLLPVSFPLSLPIFNSSFSSFLTLSKGTLSLLITFFHPRVLLTSLLHNLSSIPFFKHLLFLCRIVSFSPYCFALN